MVEGGQNKKQVATSLFITGRLALRPESLFGYDLPARVTYDDSSQGLGTKRHYSSIQDEMTAFTTFCLRIVAYSSIRANRSSTESAISLTIRIESLPAACIGRSL